MNELRLTNYQKNRYPPEYPTLLENVKEKQNKLFWQINNNTETASIKESAIPILRQFLQDTGKDFEGCTVDEISESLYNDLFEHSILTNPLKDIWVEGIDIKAWNDLELRFVNGKSIKIEGFCSPQQAAEVIHSLLQESQLNAISPIISGKLNSNIRITAIFTPIVSENVGVCCSIHKHQQRKFTTQEYVTSDFAVKRELNLLAIALQHGISILLVGNGGTGKTALMEYLLSSLPNDMRIITIEQKTREISTGTNLLADGTPSNELIEKAIGLNPDVIGYNADTCLAQNASLNGCTVIATAFSGDPLQGIRSAAEHWWWKQQDTMDYHMALEMTCSAFPLVVALHMFGDKKRRIANISECSINMGQVQLQTLWEYQIHEVTRSPSEILIHGHHKQVADVSDTLLNRMKMFGIPIDEINHMKKESDNHVGSESNRQTCGRSTDSRDQEE